MQSHIGSTKVAAHADQVSVLGTIAVDDILLAGLSDTGDGDGQTGIGRGGVAAHNVDVPFLTSQSHTFIEQLDVFYGEALAECK